MNARISNAIERLNGNYGKGKVCKINFKTMTVTVRIWLTQRTFGPPEKYKFWFDGKTVHFRGHQLKI